MSSQEHIDFLFKILSLYDDETVALCRDECERGNLDPSWIEEAELLNYMNRWVILGKDFPDVKKIKLSRRIRESDSICNLFLPFAEALEKNDRSMLKPETKEKIEI